MDDRQRRDLEAAVIEAGGKAVAAAYFSVSESQIGRWITGATQNPPAKHQKRIAEFIRNHPTDVENRPLRRFGNEELLAELRYGLSRVANDSDAQTRPNSSANVTRMPQRPARGSKDGRSRLNGVIGDARGNVTDADTGSAPTQDE